MVMVKPVIRVQYIQIRNHQGPGLLSKIYIKTHVGYHDFSTWLLIGWQDRFENRKKGKSLYLEKGPGFRFTVICCGLVLVDFTHIGKGYFTDFADQSCDCSMLEPRPTKNIL